MPSDASVSRVVHRYLGELGDRHPGTARAYRWALTNLADTWGEERLVDVLTGPGLGLWILSPTAGGREPSAASVRQRATATRALVRHALDAHLLDGADAQVALEALRRPATPPAARDTAPARILLARAAGRRPHGVSWHVWVRFRAHTWSLADTGAPERELGAARVDHLAADATTLTLGGTRHALRAATRSALQEWLEVRQGLVRTLEGSPPPQLWVRTHPSVHPRTGAVAAVGMPITARGLRKAFQDVVAALVAEDPRLVTCTVAHVRALAPVDPGSDRPAGDPAGGPPSAGGEPLP